uniref:Uncharacterized protein n=1 Tax=Oryza sativa subsp. japonica TaxID=39947 RepID=Q651K4_ORYSJ|nr:hypothetical protein [Oryza sativa Japonica Group]
MEKRRFGRGNRHRAVKGARTTSWRSRAQVTRRRQGMTVVVRGKSRKGRGKGSSAPCRFGRVEGRGRARERSALPLGFGSTRRGATGPGGSAGTGGDRATGHTRETDGRRQKSNGGDRNRQSGGGGLNRRGAGGERREREREGEN